ncbi:MAG: hypothetical protein J5525_04250 [Lachnospiraceae bacterium]|nr:hypothetical protein [Lachnospiraceae bacterium]
MIEKYVEDIRRSLENKCYFAALSLALTLPDICGSAEYPDESVTKRYINWYDEYLGKYLSKETEFDGTQNPWMSGEVVYNLRNTFLHQGLANIDAKKVKEDANKLNKFILVLGEGKIMTHLTFNAQIPHKDIHYKMMAVDVTYLCGILCDCAVWYYEANKEKFIESYTTVEQKDLEECLALDTDEGQIKMFNFLTDNGKLGREK